ncbi:MAG: hypothetical protein HKN04_00165 [Rhodothermaceae bacterium]|nr:hypothetical protein [Rhodothermaceae bacterium]
MEDAEIHQQAVARHPGRIRAVFIRDVTNPKRARAVEYIARDVETRGVPMRLIADTTEAAKAASELGLIPDDAVEQGGTPQPPSSARRHLSIRRRSSGSAAAPA